MATQTSIREKKFIFSTNDENGKPKLTSFFDIDDGAREVPVNMTLTAEGYLIKDTGLENFANLGSGVATTLYNFKKKDGTQYFLLFTGTKLQRWNSVTNVFDDIGTFTAGTKFGFKEYNNVLYGGNAVEPSFSYDGTTLTNVAAIPVGNIFEVFEDRLYVAGVLAEPLTTYYSSTGAPTTFPGANLIRPLGTDSMTGLVNYYGSMVLFKQKSIWKHTFVYDQVAAAFVPKLELLNGNYGCSGLRAYCWVENDIWFFTGTEVRALGFKDQQTGVLGINKAVISDDIKETLKRINQSALSQIICFYNDRKFYLAIPLEASTFNNTIFVSHLLYGGAWTKLKDRKKASVSHFAVKDDIIYTSSGDVNGRVYRWNSTYGDAGSAIDAYVVFKEVGSSKDFSLSKTFRYIDLRFKNLASIVEGTIFTNYFDDQNSRSKTFYVGSSVENMENTLGEILVGHGLVGDGFGEAVDQGDFLNRRVSFLARGQSVKLQLRNATLNETFTIAAFTLEGTQRPRKYFSPSKIISLA